MGAQHTGLPAHLPVPFGHLGKLGVERGFKRRRACLHSAVETSFKLVESASQRSESSSHRLYGFAAGLAGCTGFQQLGGLAEALKSPLEGVHALGNGGNARHGFLPARFTGFLKALLNGSGLFLDYAGHAGVEAVVQHAEARFERIGAMLCIGGCLSDGIPDPGVKAVLEAAEPGFERSDAGLGLFPGLGRAFADGIPDPGVKAALEPAEPGLERRDAGIGLFPGLGRAFADGVFDPGVKAALETAEPGLEWRDAGIGLFPGLGCEGFRLCPERLGDAGLNAVFEQSKPDGKGACLFAGVLFDLADALGQLGGLFKEQAVHAVAGSLPDAVHLAGEAVEGCVRALLQLVDALGEFRRRAGNGLLHAGLNVLPDAVEPGFELAGLAAEAFLKLAQPVIELGGLVGNHALDLLGYAVFKVADFFHKFVKPDRRLALLLAALACQLLEALRQIGLAVLDNPGNPAAEPRFEALDARGEIRNPLLLLRQRLGVLLGKPSEIGADVLVLLIKEGRHLCLETAFEGLHAGGQLGKACLEAGFSLAAGAGQLGQTSGEAFDFGLAAGIAQRGQAVCKEALHALLHAAVQDVEALRRFGKAIRKLARAFLALRPEGAEPCFNGSLQPFVHGFVQVLLGAGNLLGDAQANAVLDAEHLVGDDGELVLEGGKRRGGVVGKGRQAAVELLFALVGRLGGGPGRVLGKPAFQPGFHGRELGGEILKPAGEAGCRLVLGLRESLQAAIELLAFPGKGALVEAQGGEALLDALFDAVQLAGEAGKPAFEVRLGLLPGLGQGIEALGKILRLHGRGVVGEVLAHGVGKSALEALEPAGKLGYC